MINERQETIADVVAEMLEFAETDSQTIGRDVLRRRIQNFARRFEEVAKREIAELDRKAREVNLKYRAEKARHTDTYKDARIKAQDEETATLKREVAELRECLREAVTEVCNRLEKCGFKEPCVFKSCYVQKWRKALQDEGGAK